MKEIIRTVVLVALIVVAVYFAFFVNKMNLRMDYLNAQDSTHVVRITEFDHNLNDLELQFIGRGKHIQQFQRDLSIIRRDLEHTVRRFDVKVDSLGLLIRELQSNTENQLAILRRDQDETSERLTQFQRQTNRTLTDIQTALSRVNREKDELEKRVKVLETPPQEKKK
jgi:chromosome segregation ATPase